MAVRSMRSSVKTLLTAFTLLVLTIVFGVTGYMAIAGASFIDSLFMVVITIFSVGYEETIRVDDPLLMIFTVGVIIAGCSSLLYAVGGFIQMATEGEITRAFESQRKSRALDSLDRHAVICGYGRMGQIIARELDEAGFSFVIIERDEERLREAEESGYVVLKGDATEEETLLAAHIDRARALATVLPNDAANVFITLSARNMCPTLNILARGELPSTERKLTQAGANHVVLPAAIGGLRLAHMIVKPSASHLIDTLENATMINDDLKQLGVQLTEILVTSDSPAAGKTLGEIEIEGKGAFLVVAVRRSNLQVERKPSVDTVVEPGDVVILIGHGDLMPRFTLNKTQTREVIWKGDESEESEVE